MTPEITMNDLFDKYDRECIPDLQHRSQRDQGDIVGLKWSQIKEANGKDYIEIDQGKTGKKLAIVVTPAVEAVLNRAYELGVKGEYVLRTKWGRRYTEDGFRAMWQRYCRAWEALGNPRFHFHDIRAKSISDNKNLDAAYLLAGHIDIKMTRRVYDRARRIVQPLR